MEPLVVRIWKELDYMYSISSDGLVVNHITGKLLKQSFTGKQPKYDHDRPRYLSVMLHGQRYKVHRLVAMMFVHNDDPINNTQVDHIDGVKTHNWASNLEWVSNRENIKRAYENGLIHLNYGEDHHCTTHSRESAIKAIKMLASGKYTYSQITEATGFSKSMLYDIKARNVWAKESEGYIFPDIVSKPDYSMYYSTIDELILKGYSTRKIRKIYPIEDFDSQQWRSLVYNRKKSLKQRGLL